MVFQSLRGTMAQQVWERALNQELVGVACSILFCICSTNMTARHYSHGSLTPGCCHHGVLKQRQGNETTDHSFNFLKSVFVRI